ncbi:MAG: hypothetical protein KGL16_01775 [Acidobacteriota bacterium]|nr:hypothetical protein [Acidobacteriota bacterium]
MHADHLNARHRKSVIGLGLSILLALTALVLALMLALPSTANAARQHDRGRYHHRHALTIATNLDPITAGAGVLIYGQLTGPDNAHKRIWLLHRINPAQRFGPVGTTHTNASGFYEFVRADGVVNTNRSWFALGPHNTRSRVIHEWVAAIVTLSAGTASATTAQTVAFSGTVSPAHANQRVLLQQQNSTSGNGWSTVASGYTNGGSGFAIAHRFRSAGGYTLRAFFPNDPRNIASQSPSINLAVQQQQNPAFTINGSSPTVIDGQTETITGTLYAAGSTTSVQPDVPVTLYARQGTGSFRAQQSTMTDSSGAYTFTTMPLHNTVYYVRAGHHQTTARLYVGVEDVVSAAASPSTIAVGQSVKVTGTVTPDHSGHVLYLQQQSPAGQWVDVQTGYLTGASTFAFDYTPGAMGTLNLRVQIAGGPWNIGGVSATLPLTVSGLAPISTLPPAS